jgi:hypothetical protein
VNKAKENPKTVQGILGHSRIQTTLDLYTDEDLDEMIAAQEKYLDAVGFETGALPALACVLHEPVKLRPGLLPARLSHVNVFADGLKSSCGTIRSQVTEL